DAGGIDDFDELARVVVHVLKSDRRLGKQPGCTEYQSCAECQNCQAQSHGQLTSPVWLILTGVPSNRVNAKPSKSSVQVRTRSCSIEMPTSSPNRIPANESDR